MTFTHTHRHTPSPNTTTTRDTYPSGGESHGHRAVSEGLAGRLVDVLVGASTRRPQPRHHPLQGLHDLEPALGLQANPAQRTSEQHHITKAHRVKTPFCFTEASSSGSSSSSNWILMSCQPHRVTSGQSISGHKQIHISKLFSYIYINRLSSQSIKPITSQT